MEGEELCPGDLLEDASPLVFLVCDNDFVVCSSAALAKPLGLIPRLVVCAFSRQDPESEVQ